MIKRILVTLALAASIGALAACNTPAATSNPGSSTSGGGASLAPSLDTGGSEAPSESMAVPSAS